MSLNLDTMDNTGDIGQKLAHVNHSIHYVLQYIVVSKMDDSDYYLNIQLYKELLRLKKSLLTNIAKEYESKRISKQ